MTFSFDYWKNPIWVDSNIHTQVLNKKREKYEIGEYKNKEISEVTKPKLLTQRGLNAS